MNDKTYMFHGKGIARVPAHSVSDRIVNDYRKPLYIVFILDTSSSMNESTEVRGELEAQATFIPKIEQLNEGVKRVIGTLKEFERSNPLYRIYLQLIHLNSYGQAVFPEFQSVSRGFEEIRFEANGCTELRASLNMLKTFISPKYLRDDRPGRAGKGYNKAVSVILMSDGWPTDSNGVAQKGSAYRNVIDEFNRYLIETDLARNVDKYSIAVGKDACEDMLRYFCDGDEPAGENSRYYRVEECDSIAYALDFLTRATLANITQSPRKDDGSYLNKSKDKYAIGPGGGVYDDANNDDDDEEEGYDDEDEDYDDEGEGHDDEDYDDEDEDYDDEDEDYDDEGEDYDDEDEDYDDEDEDYDDEDEGDDYVDAPGSDIAANGFDSGIRGDISLAELGEDLDDDDEQ